MNIAGGLAAVVVVIILLVLIVIYGTLLSKWPVETFGLSVLAFALFVVFLVGATA